MNFLSLFVLIPLLMLGGLYLAKGIKAIRGVMVAGSTALLILSIVLTFLYLGERQAGATAEMLFRADTVWYAPLHISYSVGVDGISVAMLLLSAVIVFTGTFASWKLQPLTKEYFLWFTLLSMGVFGFFISIDLFTMFMFYEIALIPMYLLIGVWQTMGWGTILYLAAITGINGELYEAAMIDGANRWKRMWHITLPGIKSTVVTLLILNLGRVMGSNLERLTALENSQVKDFQYQLAVYIYNKGIGAGKFSAATAVGLFQSLIGLILVLLSDKFAKKLGEDGLL